MVIALCVEVVVNDGDRFFLLSDLGELMHAVAHIRQAQSVLHL